MIDVSDSELVIMNALWRRSPMRSGEIVEAISATRSWHKKTVNTLIRRLVDKGAIQYDKSPGAYLYYPAIDKDAYRVAKTTKLVSDLYDGKIAPMIATFAEADSLSDQDIAALEKVISELSER
ncbi:MAG: BlaI/MecI/CopY family transcriptional regulator [Pseudomonadota bacterium]